LGLKYDFTPAVRRAYRWSQMAFSNHKDDIEALIFDFDGTLARLEIDFGLMRTRVLALAEDFGWRPSGLEPGYVLETVEEAASALAADDPARGRAFAVKAHRIIEDMEMDAAERGGLFPEARPSLQALRASGFKMALITRNFGAAVSRVFPDWPDFFPVFLPREAVARVKPDPFHLRAALDLLKVGPVAALMIGDHPIDIETGRKTGTWTAGLASGRVSTAELAAAGADLVFEDLAGLTAYLLAGPRPPF